MNDLEKLLQDRLQQLDDAPDTPTWDNIAQKQRLPNWRLRVRHYGPAVAAAALVVTLALWGWNSHRSTLAPATADSPQPRMQTSPTPPPETGAAEGLIAIQVPENQFVKTIPATATYTPPNFSPRANSVPMANVPFAAEKGIRYQSPSTGTTVHIPASSLVDAAGQPVQGTVELLLREYRSVEEFLASGLPMHYGDERGDFAFNSGGMFEVRVVQDGQPLRMASGRDYTVDFSPTHELTDASLFYLEDDSRQWRYRPTAQFASQLEQPPVVNETVAQTNNRRATGRFDGCLPSVQDIPGKTSAEDAAFIREGVRTASNIAAGKMEVPGWFRRNPDMAEEYVLNGLERGTIRLEQHDDQKTLFFPQDEDGFFTELAAFKDCHFLLMPKDSLRSVNPAALREFDNWTRISIAPDIGDFCWMWMYAEDGKDIKMRRFYVKLANSGLQRGFDAKKVLDHYVQLREKRQRAFSTLVKALRSFRLVSPALQTDQEWCLSHPEWLDLLANKQARFAAIYTPDFQQQDSTVLSFWKVFTKRYHQVLLREGKAAQVARSLQRSLTYTLGLNQFGTYNCDQIFRLGARDQVLTYYKTPDGKDIRPAAVCMFERASKLFFSLNDLRRLTRAPQHAIDVVVTDYDGRQYHLSRERYRAEVADRKETSRVLYLKDVTAQTDSPEAWKAYLGI